ncbi:MAG TPA: type II secretion system protein [Verrucomicrobiae bacterium]|nr:type II secretion system protein [Verrucomicrobiae bacterium]
MKPRLANQKIAALTLTEVLVVIAALALLAAILLPALAAAKRKSNRINCVSQLQQIGVACRVWPSGQSSEYPAQVSVTNGGAMELATTGNVAACFRVMSNELDSTKVLICPQDTEHIPATNFDTLENSNISYFVGLDAADTQPQTLLSGDDNLIINGTSVRPGILVLHTNDSVTWTQDRHKGVGNLLLGDGSVQQATSADLTSTARLATNRLAIP